MSTDDTHECPGPGCTIRVPAHQLACRGHWLQVPEGIKHLVYQAWQRGKGAGTRAHREAMLAAVDAMRALPGGDRGQA